MTVEIIAECGINHQNDIAIAEQLIRVAWNIGASTVKFQCSTVEEEVSFKVAPDHFQELAMLVPTTAFLKECREMAVKQGMRFLCTPSGPRSLQIVTELLGVDRIKVASDNLTNVQFLTLVGRTGLPVILSTGMGTYKEIDDALNALGDRNNITLMHCVSAYPAPTAEANLLALSEMIYGFPYPVGFSDHSQSTLLPALAVAMGATVIEKHITLNNSMKGPDHAASLEPGAFAKMVDNILIAEKARGDGEKRAQPSEQVGLTRYRKSLVADRPIAAGEILGNDNVIAKRPGTGVPAAQWFAYKGMVARRAYEQDEQIDP